MTKRRDHDRDGNYRIEITVPPRLYRSLRRIARAERPYYAGIAWLVVLILDEYAYYHDASDD